MDANWFQQALDRAGVTQADLARHLRLAPSAVSRMLKGERQMKLLEAVQIANFLGVSQEELLRHAGAAVEQPLRSELPHTGPPRRGRPPRQLLTGQPLRPIQTGAPPPGRGDQIPIRSAARGGVEQQMFLGDGPIGYTLRPTNLAGVRDAYAIYMIGDSMEPRYEQGWLLHVNPFKPPIRGRDVVLYKTNDAVLIKQFIRWDSDALILHQLNPPLELRIPREAVRDCHLVVGVDQEG
jgi:phage repressor protein C with HTH and peptisase S24 domain